jgi:pre-mRNA-processing factor 19
VISTSSLTYPGSSSIAVDASGEHAIVGGSDGIAGIYSLPDDKILTVLKVGGGAITDAVWYGSQPVVATSSGAIKVFENGDEAAAFTSHAGAVHALAMHPSGEILASVGADKSFVFYDLVGKKPATQIYTECSTSRVPCRLAATDSTQISLPLHSIQMVIYLLPVGQTAS